MGGAVVLFQQNGSRAGKVPLKFFNIANRRTAECIDRLIRVADNRELTGFYSVVPSAHEFAHQNVLRMVRVLILIDQDVAEAPVVVLGDRRIVFEQSNRACNEVVEVQGVGLRQALFVFLVG